MQTVTVKLPDDMVKFLEEMAAEEERSKSYYIRKAIAQYLEDRADIRAAEKELAKIKKGQRTYTFEEVMRRNELES